MALPTPSYRLHRPSGQAVVTLNGRDVYLGKYDMPESRAKYDRAIAEWLLRGRSVAPSAETSEGLSVSEMVLAYLKHAVVYYAADGKPTSEYGTIKSCMKPLRKLYGDTPASSFGPLALKSVREEFVKAGLSRPGVNRRVAKIVRAFKWAASNELVSAEVYHALRTVEGLRRGRTAAPETEPVRPVADSNVDAIQPHVSRQVWAMVELQRLTGMRSGEVTILRLRDIDRFGKVWVYVPRDHKTKHLGHERTIYLGPRAQEIVRPWLRADPDAYLFSPAEAVAEKQAARREARKTKVQPSQVDRRKARPKKEPGDRFSVKSYARAIEAGCRKAFPHPELTAIPTRKRTPAQAELLKAWHRGHSWHPHQLRHSAATALRKEFGLDVARIILGHRSPAVTATYAEADAQKAIAVMERVG